LFPPDLQDVEFVAEDMGNAVRAGIRTAWDLDDASQAEQLGLDLWQDGNVVGPGDLKILEAVRTLAELKQAGIVHRIGISGMFVPLSTSSLSKSRSTDDYITFSAGYSLATLLRVSILISHEVEPLDLVMSYAQCTLQNCLFRQLAGQFVTRAKVKTLVNANPLGMGLLSDA
jgi:D-arabinose 1-dehydrogenase